MTSDLPSPMESALSSVSVHADSVWWPDQQDPYRLANLSLWQEYLGIQDHRNRQASGQDPQQPVQFSAEPGWHWALQTWSSAPRHQRNSPQPAENIESLPFKIETFEELKLYRKITQQSVKNIWAKPEQEKRKKDPLMNANVPEFYPSVIFHQADYPMALHPIQPIADHAYHQPELFQYREQTTEHETQWRHSQVAAFSHNAGGPAPESWYGRSGTCPFPNELLFQRTPRGQPQQQLRPAVHQMYGGLNPYHHHRQQQQVILGVTDFPELPNTRGSDQSARQGRSQNCQDVFAFTDKPSGSEEHRMGPTSVVVYQDGIGRMLRTPIQNNSRSLKGESLDSISQGGNEIRRLYRDVLASKSDEDSQTAIERRYDELEREAMEQYISSEDSEAVIGRTNETDDPFQDLERQAVEQYDDQEHENIKSLPSRENSTKLLKREQPITRPCSSAEIKSFPIGHNYSKPHLLEINKGERVNKQTPFIAQTKRTADCIEEGMEANIVGGVKDNAKNTDNIQKVTIKMEKQLYEKPLLSNSTKMDKTTAQEPSGTVSPPLDVHDIKSSLDQGRPLKEREPKAFTGCEETVVEDWESKVHGLKHGSKVRPISSEEHKQNIQETKSRARPMSSTGKRRQRNRREARCAFDGQGGQKHRHHNSAEIAETEIEVMSREECNLKMPTTNESNEKKTNKAVKENKKGFGDGKKRILAYPATNLAVEVDAKALLSRLKIRALNYLRTVDMKLMLEEKEVVRALLYGDDNANEKIRNRVRISDIQTPDIFRAYVKEMAILTKLSTEVIYRRVRREVLEMKNLHLVRPTSAEKRKVRNLIKKCLQLDEKAEELVSERRIPKKQFESLKKQVAEVLNTIHKTTEVVYCLRDMCRDSVRQLESSSGPPPISDLVQGKDPAEHVGPRVTGDQCHLLLQLGGGRRMVGLLQDRKMARLDLSQSNMYAFHMDLLVNHNLLARFHNESVLSVKQIRFLTSTTFRGPSNGDVGENSTWTKELVIGNSSFPISLEVDSISDYVCDPELVRQKDILSYIENCNVQDTAEEESKLEMPSKEEQSERCSRCVIC